MDEIGANWSLGMFFDEAGMKLTAASRTGEYPIQGQAELDAGLAALRQLPAGQRVLGVSVMKATLRQSSLPFTRLEQIRAVLPQELADTQMQRLDAPCFGVHRAPEEAGSRVLFAAVESGELRGLIDRARAQGLEPGSLVVKELAAWPLLSTKGVISDDRTTVVVDCSAEPAAVFGVRGGELLGLRLAVAQGEALGAELEWLLAEMLREYGSDVGLIALGAVPDALLQAHTGFVLPDLLALGLQRWDCLRGAGLAEAATSRGWPERMMNFRWGALGYQSVAKQWLRPWRANLALLLVLVTVGGGFWGMKYHQLRSQEQRLERELSTRFAEVLPGVPLVDPVRQVQQALGGARDPAAARSLVTWLRILYQAVPSEGDLVIKRTRFEAQTIELGGDVASYASLEGLIKRLEGVPQVGKATLIDAKRQAASQRVQFRIGLEP